MNKIVFIDSITNDERTQWIQLLNEALSEEHIVLPEQVGEETVHEVDIAIVANPQPEDLLRYPNLRLVQSVWAGVEKLVGALRSEEFSRVQVRLARLEDTQLSISMAESVLAWTLYLQRNMSKYARQQTAKKWLQLPNINSKHVRVSILGAGKLGLASLELLKKLDYQLSCWTRSNKQLDGVNHFYGVAGLKAMLAQTDILINLLPLTSETHRLLDKEKLAWLPLGSKLINFSRGSIVNTSDLIELINKGHIEHAVLDVFDQEPLPEDSELWSNPKITILPHISAPTNKKTAVKIVAETIIAYRKEQKWPECVDLSLGY